MRSLFWLLAVFAAAVALVVLGRVNAGYVLFVYPPWRVEFTMLAFAIPVGVVVIRDVVRQKLWRDFTLAVALGSAMLAMIPLWSAMTTGNWRLTFIVSPSSEFPIQVVSSLRRAPRPPRG